MLYINASQIIWFTTVTWNICLKQTNKVLNPKATASEFPQEGPEKLYFLTIIPGDTYH